MSYTIILVPFYQVQPANFRTENREPAAEDVVIGASGHLPIDGGQGIYTQLQTVYICLFAVIGYHLFSVFRYRQNGRGFLQAHS